MGSWSSGYDIHAIMAVSIATSPHGTPRVRFPPMALDRDSLQLKYMCVAACLTTNANKNNKKKKKTGHTPEGRVENYEIFKFESELKIH